MSDQTPTAETRNPLLMEIGKLFLEDSAYSDGDWRGIAVVYTVQPGSRSSDGFRYQTDGTHYAALPEENSRKIRDLVNQLRDEMQAETGSAWHQMLYQIWMPGPDFRATFEYDDPARWSLGSTSAAGAGAYADLIDPARRG